MINLASFIEKQTNKKVNIFEYKNQELKDNQELITFNNSLYIIEMEDKNLSLNMNSYFYLVYQQNLDFNTLKDILYNLYEDINIVEYKNHLLISSKTKLSIDIDTTEIIEAESYSNTYIFDLDKVDNYEILDLKVELFNKLLPAILKNNTSNKFITTKDLILYINIYISSKVDNYEILDLKVELFNKLLPAILKNNTSNKFITTKDLILYINIYISSKDKSICKLIDFNKIKTIDKNLLYTGINFIENNLNISKTSSSLFLHRNTLIYRLEKIKELLDLDLKDFKDAMVIFNYTVYFLCLKYLFNNPRKALPCLASSLHIS